MKCNQHLDKEAIAVCVSCKKFLCEDCKIKLNGRNYCNQCANELRNKKQEEYKPENFESYVKDFIYNVNDVKNKFDGFVKNKGIDKELQKIVSNVGEKARNTPLEDPFERIKKSKELFDMDAISEEEFHLLKNKSINQIINSKERYNDPLVEIKKFKELFDNGTIDQTEYQEIKQIYLNL
jgi:hypothetical protein